MLPFGENEAIDLNTDESRATLLTAEAFGIGGQYWTRVRVTPGNSKGGIRPPSLIAPTETVLQLFVYQVQNLISNTSASQAIVLDDHFEYVSATNVDVIRGDMLISQTDSLIRFQVTSSYYDGWLARGEVEQTNAPIPT